MTNDTLFPMTATEYAERAAQLAKLIASRDAFVESRRAEAKDAKEQLDNMNESISALAGDLLDRAPKGAKIQRPPYPSLDGPLVTGIEEVAG